MGEKFKTQYPGVRYREHSTRKHDGVLDRYFFIRYRLNGKPKEEGLGWSSQGWNAKKASLQLAKLQMAQKTGEGAKSLAEKRQLEEEKKVAETLAKEKALKEAISFSTIFKEQYHPNAKLNKSERAHKREEQLFSN